MQNLSAYFNAKAAELDRLYRGDGVFAKLIDRRARAPLLRYQSWIEQECGDAVDQTVLDVGCGPGTSLEALARRGAKVTGIDISESMLALARQRFAEAGLQATWRHGDAEMMPIEPHDVILAIGVFDYIADPAAFMAKLSAAARRKVIATLPMETKIWAKLRRRRYARWGIKLRYFDLPEVERIITESGLRMRRCEVIGKPNGGLFSGGLFIVADVPDNNEMKGQQR